LQAAGSPYESVPTWHNSRFHRGLHRTTKPGIDGTPDHGFKPNPCVQAHLEGPTGATTTQTRPDLDNPNQRGVSVIVNVTANAGGLDSITLNIGGKDKAPTTRSCSPWRCRRSRRPLSALPEGGRGREPGRQRLLPGTWRIRVVAGSANPISYSVGWSTLQ
jgi:hypothetical protein